MPYDDPTLDYDDFTDDEIRDTIVRGLLKDRDAEVRSGRLEPTRQWLARLEGPH